MNQNVWQWCKTFENGGKWLKLLKTVQNGVIWPKMLQDFDWEIVQKVINLLHNGWKRTKMPQNGSKGLKCQKWLNSIKILGLKAKKKDKKNHFFPK